MAAHPTTIALPVGDVLSRVVAIADFTAVREEELTFKADDVFTFLASDKESGWSQGLLNGKVGWYPQKYVKFLEGTALADHLEKEVLCSQFLAFNISSISLLHKIASRILLFANNKRATALQDLLVIFVLFAI